MPVQIIVRLEKVAWTLTGGMVRDRPRRDRPQLQPHGQSDVQHEDREQPRAGHPDQHAEIVLEEVGVVVDASGPWKTFRLPIM